MASLNAGGGRLDIVRLVIGCSFRRTLTFDLDGVPIDLSGRDFEGFLYEKSTGSSPARAAEYEIDTTDAAIGQIHLFLSVSASSTLSAKKKYTTGLFELVDGERIERIFGSVGAVCEGSE